MLILMADFRCLAEEDWPEVSYASGGDAEGTGRAEGEGG